MKPVEARKIIRERARDSGNIFTTRHAEREMRKDRIDRLDIQRCLCWGAITEGPYVPVDRPDVQRCNVLGGTADGERLEVVVDIQESPRLLVVTAFKLSR